MSRYMSETNPKTLVLKYLPFWIVSSYDVGLCFAAVRPCSVLQNRLHLLQYFLLNSSMFLKNKPAGCQGIPGASSTLTGELKGSLFYKERSQPITSGHSPSIVNEADPIILLK